MKQDIRIGDVYIIDHKKNTGDMLWNSVFPFECEVLDIDSRPENSDRKYKLYNRRFESELEVEELWWDEELTGRIIKKI